MAIRTLTIRYDDADALAPIVAIVAEHRALLEDMEPGDVEDINDEKGEWAAELTVEESED